MNAIFRCEHARVQCRQILSHALGECPYLFLGRSVNDRHIDVNTSGAGGLGKIGDAKRLERFMHQQGSLADLREVCRLDRIEIKMEIVRPVDVRAGGIPLIEIDAAEVHDP